MNVRSVYGSAADFVLPFDSWHRCADYPEMSHLCFSLANNASNIISVHGRRQINTLNGTVSATNLRVADDNSPA
jgi:hypothetical protein